MKYLEFLIYLCLLLFMYVHRGTALETPTEKDFLESILFEQEIFEEKNPKKPEELKHSTYVDVFK